MEMSVEQKEALKERFENGEDLSDEELDFVADVSIACVKDILSFFGETEITIDEYEGDEGELILDVSNGDLAVLIGRHGRTLESLQILLSSLINNKIGFHYPVIIDIEGYKNRRKQKLQGMARNAASRAVRQNGQVRLPSMNAYERRIVHMALAGNKDVTTHSEGEDPNRQVVITAV